MKRISTHEYRTLLTHDYKVVGLFSFRNLCTTAASSQNGSFVVKYCIDWLLDMHTKETWIICFLQSGSSIREKLFN